MYLETKKAVKFNDGMTGTKESVLIGMLQDVTRKGVEYLGANYVYGIEVESGKISAISKGAFELKSKEEIIELNDLIKSDLPVYEETPEPDFEEMKYILAFRVEMLKTLIPMNSDLSIEDIEIKS